MRIIGRGEPSNGDWVVSEKVETIQDDDNGHAQMRYSHDGFGKCLLLSINIPSFVYFNAIVYDLSLCYRGSSGVHSA